MVSALYLVRMPQATQGLSLERMTRTLLDKHSFSGSYHLASGAR